MRFLKALTAHLRAHDLAATVSTVRMPQSSTEVGEVQVFARYGTPRGNLPVLLCWLDSMPSATVRVTTDADYRQVHLLATGTLDDGSVIGVVTVLTEANPEQELLRANMTVEVGVPVETEWLRSLVDAKSAEARVPATAGSAALSDESRDESCEAAVDAEHRRVLIEATNHAGVAW